LDPVHVLIDVDRVRQAPRGCSDQLAELDAGDGVRLIQHQHKISHVLEGKMPDTIDTVRTSLRSLWVIGHRVTPIPCSGRVVALEVATPAGVPGPPPHYHEDCAEFFYVTAGRLGVMRDGQWSTVEVGAYAEIPRRVVHTFRNEGQEEVRAITGFEPAGFEAFFEEFGYDAAQPGSFEASVSEESIGRVVDGCARFGMVLAAQQEPER
jgi:mannose-6-phosphate isomerase-like protein (cupin superfamily)